MLYIFSITNRIYFLYILYFVAARICFPKVLSLVYGHSKTFKTHQSLFSFFYFNSEKHKRTALIRLTNLSGLQQNL